MLSLQTPQANSFVCTWEQTSSLLTGICYYFCFHSPLSPSSNALFKKLTPKLSAIKERSIASDWLNCTGKPITCYDTEVCRFDDGKLMLRLWNRKTKIVTVTRNLVLELKYDTVSKKQQLIRTCPVGQATEIFTCPTE